LRRALYGMVGQRTVSGVPRSIMWVF